MRKQMLYVTLPVCLAIVVAGSWLAKAGSLTPPVGPVASTMVTLDDIMVAVTTASGDPRIPIDTLPFGIGAPGSYVVTMPLTSVGLPGITVSASNVTIDLNGFNLTGMMAGPGEVGIIVDPLVTNVTILNGTISGWGDSGIDMAGPGEGHRVDGVTVELCGGSGIVLSSDCDVKNCIVRFNEGDGIVTTDNCRIVDTVAVSNGFPAGAGPGFGDGIYLGGANNSLEGCVLGDNYDDGVSVAFLSNTAHDCTAEGNGLGSGLGYGFLGVQRLTDCSMSENTGLGAFVSHGVVVNCVAEDNGGTGISVEFSHVSDCYADSNGDNGIFGLQSRIRDCNVTENADDGIEGSSGNFITGNNCNANLANGILITGEFNTIENNHMVANGLDGVDTAAAAMAGFPTNAIFSNRATGSMSLIDYDLDFVTNTYGVIFVGPGMTPAAAGSNANISY